MIPPVSCSSSTLKPLVWRRWTRALLLSSLVCCGSLLACGGQSSSRTSSSTHWLACDEDSDCENLGIGSRCEAGYCASAGGQRLEQRLVFSNDFDGSALDDEYFQPELGTAIRNGEAQAYTDRSENVSVVDGNLVLTAIAESFDGAQFTSGSVNTEGLFAFTFGRVEARLSAPAGRGCSSALWMLPEDPRSLIRSCIDGSACYDGTWPAWGDITIANLQSQLPEEVLGTASYGIWDDEQSAVTHGVFSGDSAALSDPSAFHVYALEWGPARLSWFVDDVLVRSLPLPPQDLFFPEGLDPFQQPFHLRLNLALGGLDQDPEPSDYPQELRVDWIRVWQWQE